MSLNYNKLDIKWIEYKEGVKLTPGMFIKTEVGNVSEIVLLGDLVIDDECTLIGDAHILIGDDFNSIFESPTHYGYMPSDKILIPNNRGGFVVFTLSEDWEVNDGWEKEVCKPIKESVLSPREAKEILEMVGSLLSTPTVNIETILKTLNTLKINKD